MIRSPIQVFVRTRPVAGFAHEAIRIEPDGSTVNIHFDRLAGSSIALNNLQQDWSFKFAKVLHNESQEAIFEACARDMVMSTLDGYNGTLLAYGQTGAGKTFTMGNATFDYKHRGITPRAISLLFRSIAARAGDGNADATVQVSYLEIYNETLRDLLLGDDADDARDLCIREDSGGRVSVKGLSKPLVATEEQALNLLFEGDANRAMSQHAHNRASSRSHTVFTIHVERQVQVDGGSQVIASKLNLVDLAGSERVAKTDSRGQILQEALYINRSLSFLEQVVIALSDKNRDHIPFRSSKLTHVLRDSLGGNSITRMVANIWPKAQHLEETISTLKFATRMMRLTTNATVNVEPDAQLLVKQYEREIAQLKKRLAKHAMNVDRAPSPSGAETAESEADVRSRIERYVAGEDEQLEIADMQQMALAVHQFKTMLIEARSQAQAAINAATEADAATQKQPIAAEKATELPSTGATGSKNEAAAVSDKEEPGDNSTGDPVGSGDGNAPNRNPVEEALSAAADPSSELKSDGDAFAEWKQSEGTALNDVYSQLVNRSRELRAQFRAAGSKVNSIKRQIDDLSRKLNGMRSDRAPIGHESSGDKIIIDEDEFEVICEMKQRKAEYMTAFNDWERIKTELTENKEQIQKIKTQMAHEFLEWSERKRPADNIDKLDDGEQLDKLETERILSTDPDSLPYYNARKALLRYAARKRSVRRPIATR